jgi:hypothetical protein
MSRTLLQQALNVLEFNLPVIEDYGSKEQLTDCHKAITKLYEELAKPEQEPVAWMYKGNFHDFDPSEWASPEFVVTPLYTAPQKLAKPEMPTKIFGPNLEKILNAAGFYKRDWVGLTQAEINHSISNLLEDEPNSLLMTLAYVIEAKLKEKNNAV